MFYGVKLKSVFKLERGIFMSSRYKTKQGDILLDYLKSRQGSHVTANEICEHCKAHGTPIGTATVYRHLEKMVDEGIVSKYNIDSNSPACFEYIGSENCCEEMCFHYKCEKCGKLVHLHCEEFKELCTHLKEHHNFVINPMRTVFYGICEECGEREK